MSEQSQYTPPALPAELKNYRGIAELLPTHWTKETVKANNISQSYYRTGGNKPPLVLLHGVLSGGLSWLRVAKALVADYDVIMPDARGHGGSARVSDEFTYQALTEDAAAFIRALKLDKPLVLGHSMGGATAAYLAAAYPELVGALIIEDAVWDINSSAKFQAMSKSPGYQGWLNNYLAYLEGLKTQNHEERLVAVFRYFPTGALWPEDEFVVWAEMQAQLDLNLVRPGPTSATLLTHDAPLSELVQHITCPILLMTGARGNCDPQTTQEVIANWHNGQHISFEEAGHLIHIDQFDRFIEVVKSFLKKQEV